MQMVFWLGLEGREWLLPLQHSLCHYRGIAELRDGTPSTIAGCDLLDVIGRQLQLLDS